jgi:hypothetical protein
MTMEPNPKTEAAFDALGRQIAETIDPDKRRSRELELALREARRFANLVFGWRELNPTQARAALRAQDAADRALGYCGCPTCSEAHDAERA